MVKWKMDGEETLLLHQNDMGNSCSGIEILQNNGENVARFPSVRENFFSIPALVQTYYIPKTLHNY